MQVDGHDVAVDRRPVDRLELRIVLAQAVELAVDLLVAHLEPRQRHLQPVIAGDGDPRPDLDDGVEGHRALLLPALDVDVRLRNGVELGVDDGRA